MSRFTIHWLADRKRWGVIDREDDSPTFPAFATLLEAETYVLERDR